MKGQEDFLSERVRAKLREIGTADILVGVPSYNNAGTIGHVIKTIARGLTRYFPGARSVIVNSDGGSEDGSQQIAEQAILEDPSTLLVQHPVVPIHKIVTPYHGLPGKGSAFRTVFKIAEELETTACAVFDADLRSITPEWVEKLLIPVYEKGFDYVAPLYRRHKYDGTITNSIVYPLTRALYEKRVRQPIGGDFGFSGKLAHLYLTKDVWETDVARFGIDVWMTTTAVAEGYRVCEAFLGAKVHDPKDPGAHLASMLMQVVGSVFSLMEEYPNVWRAAKGSSILPVFGPVYEVATEPVSVDVERMVSAFRLGLQDLLPIWETVLSQETLGHLLSLGAVEGDAFRFPAHLWVLTVYDFALAYHDRVIHRDHLLKALTPLYLGKIASFVLETRHSGPEEVDGMIENLCEQYEAMKPYLMERWR
jgi:hypothetical protein